MATVYNSRAPGAVNFIPRAPLPEGARTQAPLTMGGQVTGLPQAGSPLMQQLVKFIQARNPAMVVNEGNVQANLPQGPLDRAPGTNFRIPGAGRNILRQLQAAGLASMHGPSFYPNRVPPGMTVAELPAHWQASVLARGANARGIGELNLANQAANANFSGGGVSAPMPQVPVATLPEPAMPAPLAQTPVGPMYFPPGPAPFGAQDPRRNYLFR